MTLQGIWEWRGAPIRCKAPEKIFVVPLHFFGSKSTISWFGERFCDGQYSLVSFLFAVLLPPCPAICKSGGHVPPVPHGVGATGEISHGPKSGGVRSVKTYAGNAASEMTYIVSGGALNSTHSRRGIMKDIVVQLLTEHIQEPWS